LISKSANPELFDAAQALKFGCVNRRIKRFPSSVSRIETDDVCEPNLDKSHWNKIISLKFSNSCAETVLNDIA